MSVNQDCSREMLPAHLRDPKGYAAFLVDSGADVVTAAELEDAVGRIMQVFDRLSADAFTKPTAVTDPHR